MTENAFERRKNRKITIRQVAEEAGVTIGTVSHVINGTASISPQTTERVQEAIKKLQYVPNLTAKSLRARQSKQIGMLIPNLNNSFYSKIASTFQEQAFENGFIVHILGYEYSVEKEMKAIESLVGNSVDIVVIMNGHDDETGIRRLLNARKQVILADRTSDMEGIHCVCFDNKKVIAEAMELLKKKGYKRIGFLSEPLTFTNVQERFEAYKEGLRKYGYEYSEDLVWICEEFRLNPMKNGYQYIHRVLKEKELCMMPDAFLATSDLLAVGAIRAMRECGYQVPGDVGVISFDNLDISLFVDPPLTTIEQDQVMMGQELFRIVRAITENQTVPQKTVLPQRLIERSSC